MQTLNIAQISLASDLAREGYSIPYITERLELEDQKVLRRYLSKADLDVDPRGTAVLRKQVLMILTTLVPATQLPKDIVLEDMSYRYLSDLWASMKEKAQ